MESISEEQPLEGDVSGLRDELRRLMLGSGSRDPEPSDSQGDDLKIKFQYLEEKGALNVRRPPDYSHLQQYLERRFRRQLNIYYTTSSRELMIQIRSQLDLDQVVELHDRGNRKSRLRLILAKKRDQDEAYSPPQGIFHGNSIHEATFSETSSLFSQGSTSHSYVTRYSDEDQRISTPIAPSSWRESRCLGRGSFGTVYVCLNVDTNVQLVVKKIYFTRTSRSRSMMVASLENEVNLLSSLHHPHIVQYHGCVRLNDCFCIFMEFMTGGTLKEQITEWGALSEGFAVDFTAQILSGLSYLHEKRIIHRDIKNANILRDTTALVKIGDFGSATFLQAICSENGVDIHGTPHYTAPEIVLNSRKCNQQSDIWSLGICLVEMLTTKTPWHDIDPSAVHLKIGYEGIELNLPENMSSQLRDAITNMLQKDPEKRPSAQELLNLVPFNCIKL